MYKRIILGLFMSWLMMGFTHAQTTTHVAIDGPGWKKVGYNRPGSAGRGFGRFTIFTTGGSNAPRYLDVEWFKDWSVLGGISVSTNSGSGFWTGVRITHDNDTCFIEVNFTKAIPNGISVLRDDYGWFDGHFYSGVLPSGGGVVHAEVSAAAFNISDQLLVGFNGNVGIGTTSPTSKLAVNGDIRAKEIKVEATNWPDYVFEDGYVLRPLSEVDGFIKKNGHLPEIPKASEVETKGIALGEMNKLLLKKVEELTLYLIERDKELQRQRQVIDVLGSELAEVRSLLNDAQ